MSPTVISLRTSTAVRVDREQAVALLLDAAYHLMRGDPSDFNERLGAMSDEADNREMDARFEWEHATDGRLQWHDSALTVELSRLLDRVKLRGMLEASVAPPLVATPVQNAAE